MSNTETPQEQTLLPPREGIHQRAKLGEFITPDGKFTSEHTGQLFFDSFRFSQGDPSTQQQIFKYLAQYYGNYLTPENIEEGVTLVASRISRFVLKGVKHAGRPTALINMTIDNEQRAWQSELNKDTTANCYSPLAILTAILAQEAWYASNDGRPNRSESEETGAASKIYGRHLSQFVYYGLLGRDTGAPEYNAMFAGLVDRLQEVPDSVSVNIPGKEPEPILPIFTTHFNAYPDDIASITSQGLAALRQRFEPSELQLLGIAATEEYNNHVNHEAVNEVTTNWQKR